MSPSTIDFIQAAPINAIGGMGFGQPEATTASLRPQLLDTFENSNQGVWVTVESAGRIGRRLLAVLSSLGGAASAEQLAFQTAGAAPGVIDAALDRLVNARLAHRQANGSVGLSVGAKRHLATPSKSLADQQAITSDALAIICRALALVAPGQKQGRIDAIAQLFADPQGVQHVRAALSGEAVALLERIAAAAGPASINSELLGISSYLLHAAEPSRYFHRAQVAAGVEALHELTSRGIVGVAAYDQELWIWREAWPLLGRPFYREWSAEPVPRTGAVTDENSRLPGIVSVVDRALQLWGTSPPSTLKNGAPRIAKTDTRAASKSLGADEATVDVAGRLAIGIGLLRRNTVGTSGRGRNQRVEQAWMGDPTMIDAWAGLAPSHRWVRLLAQWFTPPTGMDHEGAIRHLLVWQLSLLDVGQGYVNDDTFVSWFTDQYGPAATEPFTRDSLIDMRALGVVTTSGPLALTAVGRAAIEDPESIGSRLGGAATHAIVQGDLSVVAPPDLRDDLTSRIESIAVIESSTGTVVYRLDLGRITHVVQSGSSADELIDFLALLSATPLPDAVVRLVRDAAAKAGTVRVVSTATVVVVSDPADLVTACSIKAIGLTRLNDTVAVTDVPIAKVRAALERKGLTPEILISGSQPEARSSAVEAAEATRRAAELRAASSGRTNSYFEYEAKALEARAKSLGDIAGRLQVRGPLAPTIAVVERLNAASTERSAPKTPKGGKR